MSTYGAYTSTNVSSLMEMFRVSIASAVHDSDL